MSQYTNLSQKKAADITVFVVIAPSLSSLIPHLSIAQWDLSLVIPLLIAGVIGSFVGVRFSSYMYQVAE